MVIVEKSNSELTKLRATDLNYHSSTMINDTATRQ